MEEHQKIELWNRYSKIWRNVLSKILDCTNNEIEQFVEDLRLEMEIRVCDPDDFGFFYDLPSRYLFSPILTGSLLEQTRKCNFEQVHPMLNFQNLIKAITNNENEWELENPNFDWIAARARYLNERSNIEARLLKGKT